jgi:hypothetical protein
MRRIYQQSRTGFLQDDDEQDDMFMRLKNIPAAGRNVFSASSILLRIHRGAVFVPGFAGVLSGSGPGGLPRPEYK